MRRKFLYSPPPLGLLSSMDNDQLCHVAARIAKKHYFEQLDLQSDAIHEYVRKTHEYGALVPLAVRNTNDGQMARLRSEYFWREQVNSAADLHREHMAMKGRALGDPLKGLMPYCSDETFRLMETRREAIDLKMAEFSRQSAGGLRKSIIYSDSQRSKFNQLYLSGKAMAVLGQQRGYVCGLITLTCPPRYHPASPQYDGSSFRDGHEYLNALYRKLFRHLGKTYKANDDYFGIRVVEAHLDGCPHWHIVLFSTEDFFEKLTYKLSTLYISDERPEGYFEDNKSDILRIFSYETRTSTPLSYICKHLAFALQRMKGSENHLDSLRNLYAIRAAGVRQVQLIGANGLSTKLKALRRVARSSNVPRHLNSIASGLVQPPTCVGRENQLSGVVKLLDGGLEEIELIRTPTMNRYGEVSLKLNAIRHHRDIDAHALECSLSQGFHGGALNLNDLSIKSVNEPADTPAFTRLNWMPHESFRQICKSFESHSQLKSQVGCGRPHAVAEIVVPTRLRWRPP